MAFTQGLPSLHRSILLQVYEGLESGAPPSDRIGEVMHPDYEFEFPSWSRWGGRGKGIENLMTKVAAPTSKILGFSRLEVVSVTADDERRVAVFDVGIEGTEEKAKICEVVRSEAGKTRSVQVFYFDPAPILRRLEREEGLRVV